MSTIRPRYLTKSRFKLALECITKLYYTGKKSEYADQNLDDPFLQALAEGGFQVGELAKFMFIEDPIADGITIDTLDYEESLKETNARLNRSGRVVIAEAAFKYRNLFIRADVIVKEGNRIDLYEVKAKSFDGEGEDGSEPETKFISYEGKPTEIVNSKWQPYLYDLAFQKYVITKAFPEMEVNAYLLMVNKNAKASIEGLNQKFRISRNGKQKKVVVEKGLKAADLGNSVLESVLLNDVVDKIWNKYPVPSDLVPGMMFPEFVEYCEKNYAEDKQVFTALGKKCRDCQFTLKPGDSVEMKSGFQECWKKLAEPDVDKLKLPLVLELWGGGAGSRSFPEELIRQGKYFLKDVVEVELQPKSASKNGKSEPGLSKLERRMEQVNRVKRNDQTSYFDQAGLMDEMKSWTWPLHMIDFETSMVALPFHKNTRPYQGIAFQFSHHIMFEDGKVVHADQFLHLERGVYPNVEFVRALKKALEKDKGSIFRYHNHENTYLRMIHRQLSGGLGEISTGERKLLIEFIDTITRQKSEDNKSTMYGTRDMIDLYDLVIRYYYPPYAKGSNSLKQILPSIIRDSKFLQEKYGRPGVYGRNLPVKSLNVDDHIWIQKDKELDPYKTLPLVFQDVDRETLDNLVKDFEGLADGGAALTAYNYLQFASVPEDQTKQIADALLRYCELDTLAMVMIVEGWRNWRKV